jgi:putative ABC transport system permease protein
MNNFRYAVRTLRKNIGFTLTVVILLALGIGGNIAVFSIVNAALLRPLPYEHPDRLVELWGNVQRAIVERRGGSMLDYRDWKDQNHSFDGLASFWDTTFAIRRAEERVPVRGQVVGSEYFRLLGLKPVLGRDFRPEEETDSTLTPVVVLAHEFWAQRMGSDPAVIGKQLTLDTSNYTVVGVMPRGFRGIDDQAELWIPTASLPERAQQFRDRGTRGLVVLGRLREGISSAQAQADMDTISRALERAYPATNDKRGVEVASLAEEVFGNVRPALLMLLGAVSLVLLIACANVTNLMLLRTETRHAEIAIRTAIGATRRELLKVVLGETFLLSFAGTALGLLISVWVVDVVLAISPIQLPSFVNVTLDRNVILFAAGLSCFIALLTAIAPALAFAPADVHEALSSNSTRTTGARSTKRFRNALVVGEFALSFVLLLSAGLLIQSFRHLLHIDTGFETSRLLGMRLVFDGETRPKAAAVKEALENLPGVKFVALSNVIPFTGGPASFYSAEGQELRRDATTAPRAYIHFVTPGYFQTMGIPMRQGRDFTITEPESSVIVSEKVAQRFWPGQDPIGKRIKIGQSDSTNPWMNIVAVVGETKTRDIPDNPTQDPDLYMTFERYGGSPGVLIRSGIEPANLIPVVLNEIKRVDKLAVVSNPSTIEELMRPRTAPARFLSSLSGIFSGMALVLALVGIYGSMSYTVAQRTREFGVRIALGANGRDVVRMVLGRSLVLIASGLALGLIGSFFAGRGISGLLIGISATAPSVFLVTSALMVITGLGAAYIPARRAARIDPLLALREE